MQSADYGDRYERPSLSAALPNRQRRGHRWYGCLETPGVDFHLVALIVDGECQLWLHGSARFTGTALGMIRYPWIVSTHLLVKENGFVYEYGGKDAFAAFAGAVRRQWRYPHRGKAMVSADDMEYCHPELNTEITAIGGQYVFTHEHRFTIDGADVLVFEGYGLVETSCCGTGGCRYAMVPGDLLAYRCTRLAGGQWVSRVSPLHSEIRRRAVTNWLMRRMQVQQVVLM